jgi:hypothetical protein
MILSSVCVIHARNFSSRVLLSPDSSGNSTIKDCCRICALFGSPTLSKLTEEYAYTNEGIKKICNEFDVPLPGNGYWSKLKFNSKIKKTKLNPIFNGIDKIELILREEGSLVNIDQNPLTIRTKEIESDTKAPLKVPEKLKNPDIVTIQTQEFWKSTKDKPFYSRSEKVVFHIRVGKEHQNRALLFMDSLAKLLRYRGHTFAKEYNETKILIKDIFIEFDLREASKRIPSEKPYGTSDYIPTGELIFKIGRYSGEKEWRDGKTKLEDLLARIVAKLEIVAEQESIQKEASRLWRIEYDEKLRKEEEVRQQKRNELNRTKQLLIEANLHNKANIIRHYLEIAKQNAINKEEFTIEKEEWLNWANKKADWIDPLVNCEDELLNDDNKLELLK